MRCQQLGDVVCLPTCKQFQLQAAQGGKAELSPAVWILRLLQLKVGDHRPIDHHPIDHCRIDHCQPQRVGPVLSWTQVLGHQQPLGQISRASESRSTTAPPQAPSPGPARQGSESALGSSFHPLPRSLSHTATRAAASSQYSQVSLNAMAATTPIPNRIAKRPSVMGLDLAVTCVLSQDKS